MGSDLSVNSELRTEYCKFTLSQVGKTFQKFWNKRDFFQLLAIEDFQYFFGGIIKNNFYHYETYGGVGIGALEVFSCMYFLCDHRCRCIEDKLDALISLVQFRPVPETVSNFTYNEPNEDVHIDEVKLLFNCLVVGLCKLCGKALSVSAETISAVADGLFLSEGTDRSRWVTVKREILNSATIVLFLRQFVNVVHLPPILTDLDRHCSSLQMDLVVRAQATANESLSKRTQASTSISLADCIELIRLFASRTPELNLQHRDLTLLETSIGRVVKHGQIEQLIFLYIWRSFVAFILLTKASDESSKDLYGDQFVSLLYLASNFKSYSVANLADERTSLVLPYLQSKKCDETRMPPMPISYWLDFRTKSASIRFHCKAGMLSSALEAMELVNLTHVDIGNAIREKMKEHLLKLDPLSSDVLTREMTEVHLTHLCNSFVEANDPEGRGTVPSDSMVGNEELEESIQELANYLLKVARADK